MIVLRPVSSEEPHRMQYPGQVVPLYGQKIELMLKHPNAVVPTPTRPVYRVPKRFRGLCGQVAAAGTKAQRARVLKAASYGGVAPIWGTSVLPVGGSPRPPWYEAAKALGVKGKPGILKPGEVIVSGPEGEVIQVPEPKAPPSSNLALIVAGVALYFVAKRRR